MICLLSALIMLFGYLFIEKSSFGNGSNIVSTEPKLMFNDDILGGDPGF